MHACPECGQEWDDAIVRDMHRTLEHHMKRTYYVEDELW